jgi:hypothetical protein
MENTIYSLCSSLRLRHEQSETVLTFTDQSEKYRKENINNVTNKKRYSVKTYGKKYKLLFVLYCYLVLLHEHLLIHAYFFSEKHFRKNLPSRSLGTLILDI